MGGLNFRLLVEYDGTAFHGWQLQRNQRTVQGELQSALVALTGQQKVTISGAGRTDAGVHARGQVASVTLNTTIPPEKMQGAINSRLPEDVRIQSVSAVAQQFDARRSALGRRYSYSITTMAPVLGRQYVWALHRDLDAELLERCAATVVGRHDFVGFAKANPEVDSTICRVELSSWEQSGRQFVYEIMADRFLHHMVRYLVGTMVEVARGRYSPDQFRSLLEQGPGEVSPQRAPASGLVLEEVRYPPGADGD